jgi:fatty acid amide hydrolase
MKLWSLSASRLSELMTARDVSSEEVVQAHLDRIREVNPKLRAFVDVLADQALLDARQKDQERARGACRGPLHGLPVSVKECFDLAGKPTTLGIAALQSPLAVRDAALVQALREAGAILLGRTNLSQAMLYVESRNPLFGQTSNPFRPTHTPGGSSGGEAAAIASGMSPLGLGTDIGGSIRTPCHFSGIAGIKPTLDRLPARGYRTAFPGQEAVRAQVGPMARSSRDLALFFSALPSDMSPLDPRTPPLAWVDLQGVQGLRVGLYTDDGVLPVSTTLVRAVLRAADALRDAGATVVPFVPPRVSELVADYLACLSADGGATLAAAVGDGPLDPVIQPLRRLASVPDPLRRAAAGLASMAGETRLAGMLRVVGKKSVAEYWALTNRLRAYRTELLDALDAAKVDLVLCPPYATCALPHLGSKNFTLASSYCMLWNAVQFPAGVVPVTRVRNGETLRASPRDSLERHAAKVDAVSLGLPCGVQVVGRPWREDRVLAAMMAIEDAVCGDEDFPRTPVEAP